MTELERAYEAIELLKETCPPRGSIHLAIVQILKDRIDELENEIENFKNNKFLQESRARVCDVDWENFFSNSLKGKEQNENGTNC